MKSQTHKKRLIEMMLEKHTTSALVHGMSNPNQYFCELEKEGFCKSVWGFKGKARVKFRFIPDDKVEDVKKHYGIVSNTSQNVHSIGSH